MVLESVQHPERDVPEYLTVDAKLLKGNFARVPKMQDVPYPVLMEPNLVIEYYSR
jgi:small subunit ribosomal protein S4